MSQTSDAMKAAILRSGLNVTLASERFGVSPKTVRRILDGGVPADPPSPGRTRPAARFHQPFRDGTYPR